MQPARMHAQLQRARRRAPGPWPPHGGRAPRGADDGHMPTATAPDAGAQPAAEPWEQPAAFPRACLTYNVFGGGPHAEARLPHLVAVVAAADPDVLCLQEATPAIIAELQSAAALPYALTKLGLVESSGPLPPDDRSAVCAAGFLAVLSKHPLGAARLVHSGGWLDDGILRVEVQDFGVV
eukprot:SAG22_NODE_769_length_7337_cov_15.897624_7_plen_180_part_00